MLRPCTLAHNHSEKVTSISNFLPKISVSLNNYSYLNTMFTSRHFCMAMALCKGPDLCKKVQIGLECNP